MKHIDEFIKEAAEKYAATMVEENKNFLMDEPDVKKQHAVRRAYIQKYFIENRNLSEYQGFKEPEYLSSRILEYTLAILLPEEYDVEDEFVKALFSNEEFIRARLLYKENFGNFPVEIIADFRQQMTEERNAYYEKLNELEKEEDVEQFDDVLSSIYGVRRKYIRRCIDAILQSMGQKQLGLIRKS